MLLIYSMWARPYNFPRSRNYYAAQMASVRQRIERKGSSLWLTD